MSTARLWHTVALTGSLDGASSDRVRDLVNHEVACNDRVLLNLSEVDYISSAGLRTLLVIHREAQRAGSEVALTGMSAEISHIMSITGFLGLFTVIEDGGGADRDD